jgi:cell division inhibitor SepF
MGFSDVWNRTLVYFGIAEEEDWDDELMTEEEVERSYQRDRQNVRRLAPRRSRDRDDWTDSGDQAQTQVARPRLRGVEPLPSASVKVHLILPRSFNDAQQIADRFKDGVPVIINLQSADNELSKRLIDFASGLTYALDGGMQRVEVSAEERARMLERGGFFNQA